MKKLNALKFLVIMTMFFGMNSDIYAAVDVKLSPAQHKKYNFCWGPHHNPPFREPQVQAAEICPTICGDSRARRSPASDWTGHFNCDNDGMSVCHCK